MTARMTPDEIMALQPVLPVITIDDASHAAPLAEVMLKAGLPALEVTLRTPAALAAISALSKIPGLVVGAGTILSADDVEASLDAGAQFILTPGYTHNVVTAARNAGVAIMPGVCTPSEIMTGLEMGLNRFKFFPAEQAGGIHALDALHGPFSDVRFCPTGGITSEIAPAYLRLPNVAMVGGGWVAPRNLIRSNSWDEISFLAEKAAKMTRS